MLKMANYEKLKSKYPNYICLDELSKICKIGKQSARYLVEHELIPAIDTGKQTWRYKIAIDDVITYLKQRDKLGSMSAPAKKIGLALNMATVSHLPSWLHKDMKMKSLNILTSFTPIVKKF